MYRHKMEPLHGTFQVERLSELVRALDVLFRCLQACKRNQDRHIDCVAWSIRDSLDLFTIVFISTGVDRSSFPEASEKRHANPAQRWRRRMYRSTCCFEAHLTTWTLRGL